jgi:hypothetical protein
VTLRADLRCGSELLVAVGAIVSRGRGGSRNLVSIQITDPGLGMYSDLRPRERAAAHNRRVRRACACCRMLLIAPASA